MEGGLDNLLVENWDDLLSAELALLPLAVGRSEPMLAHSGLPTRILESPQQLRELARDAISSARASRSSAGIDEAGGRGGASHFLADFLVGVTAVYGPRVAADLLDWLHCLHVDQAQRNRLSSWVAVLQLAAAMRDAGTSYLDPAVRQILVDSAEREFGPSADADLEQAVIAASQIPLTDPEQRLLAMEVSRIGDVDQWDVIQDMELNTRLSSARSVRAELKSRLTPGQFQTVLDWGRRLLEGRGDAFGAQLLASDRDCGEAAGLRHS